MSKCYLDIIKVGFIAVYHAFCDCIDPKEDPCDCALPYFGTACLYNNEGYCTCPEAISREWAAYQKRIESIKMRTILQDKLGVNHG